MEAEESETDLALDRFYLNSRNKFLQVFASLFMFFVYMLQGVD